MTMDEFLLKISRWWNTWWYVPKHSSRGYWQEELPPQEFY